jgi:hypothetical protein
MPVLMPKTDILTEFFVGDFSYRKIHTQNVCHNIPRGKTQKAFWQRRTSN